MQNYKFASLFFIYLFFAIDLSAGSAGRNYTYETQEIILFPTAGLAGNKQMIDFDFIGKDILIASFKTMLLKDVSLGCSIALEGLLSNNTKFGLENYPAITIKYRFLNEGKYYPAMVIGFDSHNFINIPIDKTQEFHHSIGPFLVLSKAFSWQFGILGLHLGANLPIEFNPYQKGNFFFGVEHTLNKFASVAVEYDFNGANNKKGLLGKGIINLGLKYSIDRNVTLQYFMLDVFSQNFNTFKIFKVQFISKIF